MRRTACASSFVPFGAERSKRLTAPLNSVHQAEQVVAHLRSCSKSERTGRYAFPAEFAQARQ